MATATAVSFRKGTREEHTRFRGAEGEVTVDLTQQTVWVHSGNDREGVPLAREDLQNVDTSVLANKGVATTDLTNVQLTNVSIVRSNLASLGYAYNDMSNVNTGSLANNRTGIGTDKNLAYADGTNINTDDLADLQREKGGSLAYANLTNVTMATLQDKLGNSYAKADFSNIDTGNLASDRTGEGTDKNLAYADLSNLETLSNPSNVYAKGIQLTSNLTQNLDSGSTAQYPSVAAVKTQFEDFAEEIDAKISEIVPLPSLPSGYFNSEYVMLYGAHKYTYNIEILNAGTGYSYLDLIYISNIPAYVTEVDETGSILDCELGLSRSGYYGSELIEGEFPATYGESTGTGSGATFNITSTENTNLLRWLPQEDKAIPTLVKNVVMEETTGTLTITVNQEPTNDINIHTLTGVEIAGTWATNDDIIFTFVPTQPDDILTQAWIINVE